MERVLCSEILPRAEEIFLDLLSAPTANKSEKRKTEAIITLPCLSMSLPPSRNWEPFLSSSEGPWHTLHSSWEIVSRWKVENLLLVFCLSTDRQQQAPRKAAGLISCYLILQVFSTTVH